MGVKNINSEVIGFSLVSLFRRQNSRKYLTTQVARFTVQGSGLFQFSSVNLDGLVKSHKLQDSPIQYSHNKLK